MRTRKDDTNASGRSQRYAPPTVLQRDTLAQAVWTHLLICMCGKQVLFRAYRHCRCRASAREQKQEFAFSFVGYFLAGLAFYRGVFVLGMLCM